MSGAKVAVCTPCHSMMSPRFVSALIDLLNHSRTAGGEHGLAQMTFFWVSVSYLPLARNMLVGKAREWGADHMLWLDADQVFPKDALLRLMAHELPVVGANYPRRVPPFEPTATTVAPDGGYAPVRTDRAIAEKNPLEPVAAIGFGVCLVAMDVYARIPDPPFSNSFGPNLGYVGEDYYFCNAVRAAGIEPVVDHALSLEVGHIAESIARFT